MKDSIRRKLVRISARASELNLLLLNEAITEDLDAFRRISRELAEMNPLVALFDAHMRATSDLEAAREMSDDVELREFAESEVDATGRVLAEIEARIQQHLVPKDPDDERNAFLEIRAGTGGDESALFAGDLFRMYSRYAERKRWQVEAVSVSASELGGFREVIARITGNGVYSRLKFESGGHRVQRVPLTESQGRVHTSACTVAVLAEADAEADVLITPSDVRIDTFRASGAGGQHINKTDSAVRVTHLRTGLVVECQDDRSQHKNKAQALAVLAARLKDQQSRERASKVAAERKMLVGSGDRSERIRTYNYPQGRVTDHRINLTLHKIGQILDGDLDELMMALMSEYQAEQLAALSED
ncbi:MAG: peptide chain release factor 1 [Betaproteobacteria bacterium]|jgi:peptide chain release factor 1